MVRFNEVFENPMLSKEPFNTYVQIIASATAHVMSLLPIPFV